MGVDSIKRDWQAKWIWARGRVDALNCYVYTRHEFRLSSLSSARAAVACSSEYKLYVNGRYIGRGPSPRRGDTLYYDEYDLTHALRPGKNVIAALCYNAGVDAGARPAAPGGFLCEIEISENGDTRTIGTGEGWRVRPGNDWDCDSPRVLNPSMGLTLGFRELYDSRGKPVGWNVVGYDDSGWEDACVVAGSGEGCQLVPRPVPPLKEWEVFPERVIARESVEPAEGLLHTSDEAAIVDPGAAASVTVDFGREIAGYPVLRIRDGGFAVIELDYGASPDVSGGHVIQSDRVTLHGGRREWQTFGRRTFRYIRLAISELDAPLQIESVSASCIGYPVQQVTTFECSDESLNEAWRHGVHTLSLCMQDCYESNPLSDPIERPAFARTMALANYHCFFDTLLAANALRRFAASPSPDPAWIVMLHDYYLYTGDQSLIDELYPALRRTLEEAPDLGDSAVLRDAAKLATACGSVEDALAWHERAEGAQGSPTGSISVEELIETIRRGDPVASSIDAIAPVRVLIAEVLGVKPSLPGSPVVIVQPHLCDVKWARGQVQTHKGPVDVEWRSERGRFELDITAPYGFIAALPVAGFENPVIDEIDTSPETPERRARRNYGWGSTIWKDRRERDPYLDWLETQWTEPPADYIRRMRCSSEEGYLWVRECPLSQVRYVIREASSVP